MLKRAGRGHDSMGATGTLLGELAVECPACPQPEINLPDSWDAVVDESKYVVLNILFSLELTFADFCTPNLSRWMPASV